MRAFSLVEIMVVVSVTAVVAGGAIMTLSGAARRNRVQGELDRLLDDVAEQRASHVAAGRSDRLIVCVGCLDGSGGVLPSPGRVDQLDFFLEEGDGPRVLASKKYELKMGLDCGGKISLDALGRPIDADDRAVDCKLTLRPAGEQSQSISFAKDGRLLPTFADPLVAEPVHVQNLSSRTTPVPMSRGRFSGDPSRALQVNLR